jgi:hypothetical protein
LFDEDLLRSIDFKKYSFKIDMLGYRGDSFDFLMILCNFLKSISKVNSLRDFFFPIWTLLSQITGRNYTEVLQYYAKHIYALFVGVFGFRDYLKKEFSSFSSEDYESFETEDPFVQSEERNPLDDFLDYLKTLSSSDGRKSFLNSKKSILCSQFSQRLGTFCGMLICLPIFANNKSFVDFNLLGFSKAYVYRLKKQYKFDHPLLLLDYVMDTVVFFIDRVSLAYHEKDFRFIWLDDKDMIKYDTDYNYIMYYYDRLDLISNQINKETGCPLTLNDYLTLVDNLCDRNVKYAHILKDDVHMCSMFRTHRLCLERVKLRVQDKMKVNAEREPPLGFVLHGTPKIGKSSLIHRLCTMLYQNAKYLGKSNKDYDKSLLYSYNPNDAYFSQFRVSHEICVVDDVGQFKTKILENDGGGALKQSINMIGSVPYTTEQAELENKGMIPFMCKYVILTTNVRDAGLSTIFREESGAKRRYIFLDVQVKEQYRELGTTMLEGCGDSTFHEMWDFVPRMYKNVNGKNNEVVWNIDSGTWDSPSVKVRPLSMYELQHFLLNIQSKHYNNVDTEKEGVVHFMESGYCDIHKANFALCPCEKLQCEDDDSIVDEDELLPSAQSDFFHVDIRPWLKAFYNAFGWNGVWVLIKHRFIKDYMGLRSNASVLYIKHKNAVHTTLGFLSIIGFMILLRKFIKFGNILRAHEPDVQHDNEPKPSPWMVSYREAQRVTGKPQTTTLDRLVNTVSHNCVVLSAIIGRDQYTTIRALAIYGFTLVVPRHWVDRYLQDIQSVDIIRHNRGVKMGPSRFGLKLDESNIEYLADKDICLISHPGFGNFRDLRPYLLSSRFSGSLAGKIIIRDDEGVLRKVCFSGLQQRDFHYNRHDKTKLFCRGYCGQGLSVTNPGECGSPYIVQTIKGCFIAGIHIAGGYAYNRKEWLVYCHPVLSDLKKEPECASFNGIGLKDSYPLCQNDYKAIIHPKDPVLEAAGTITVYGDLCGFRPKIKSDVCDTMMVDDVLQHYDLLERTHVSPKGCSYRNCLINNYKLLTSKPSFQPRDVKRVRDGIFEWYVRVIEQYQLEMPNAPYDIDVGVNGIDSNPYINRLPVNTSGGFTRGGRKDKYFVSLVPSEDHQVRYGLDRDALYEYHLLLSRYKQGERGQVIWNYNFKDEPISHKKHALDKVRLFNAGTLAFNVLFRQYFLWTIPLFCGKHNFRFGSAIGTNCFSYDWNILYDYIVIHGRDRIIAGDYSAFDKRQPPELLWAAFEILFKIAVKYGWHDDDVIIMRGLATDVCYSMCNIFGTLVELQGSNPSGNPLTTILNGIVNIMYIMLACDSIARQSGIDIDLSNFQDYMSILTYGDDNIMSSSLDICNHTSISAKLLEFGVVYTMADKNSKSVPFINICDADFLKRRFVPNVNMDGRFACPLDESSIIKSLHVCTRSRVICFEQQMAEIIRSAHMEYFQYGYDKFKKEESFLNGLLDKYNLRMYLPNGELLTYNQMYIDMFADS